MLPIPRHIVDMPVVIKTFKISKHLIYIDYLMMQIKITIILPVYLFFGLLIQTALPIISIIILKSQNTPKNFLFVLSLKLNFQEKLDLDIGKVKRANFANS